MWGSGLGGLFLVIQGKGGRGNLDLRFLREGGGSNLELTKIFQYIEKWVWFLRYGDGD